MRLTEFLQKNGCESNLARLMGEIIPCAVKKIAEEIRFQDGLRHAQITDGKAFLQSKNASGEVQLALDLRANGIILEELEKSGIVESSASEEMEDVLVFRKQSAQSVCASGALNDDAHFATQNARTKTQKLRSNFCVVFDPLDGSSLADVNFSVGSIFGVYPAGNLIGRTGSDQLAAAYAVYGPRTTLVLTVKKGTHEFRLEADGAFYLSRENLRVTEESKHFAPGNLRAAVEREDYLKLTNEWIKKGLTLRYSGGMVPDINHILLKGNGVFAYPPYSKTPNGKLRLLFECNPMSLLMEQSGGTSESGRGRILTEKIKDIHQRMPIYIGSKKDVAYAARVLHG